MSQIDPWEKAAECARAIRLSFDPHHKAVLANFQQMWIALGNQRNSLSQDELARESEKIGRLQVRFGFERTVR